MYIVIYRTLDDQTGEASDWWPFGAEVYDSFERANAIRANEERELSDVGIGEERYQVRVARLTILNPDGTEPTISLAEQMHRIIGPVFDLEAENRDAAGGK